MDLGSYDVVNLDVAVGKYAHTRALFDGGVQVAGLELNRVDLPVSTILNEVLNGATWDVSEMSMGRFVQITAKQPTEFVGLPIFPCRAFRHAAFYVLASSKLVPTKLSGCRIGIPGWAVTAVIYARALMMHQWGIPIDEVEWIVGDVDGADGDLESPALPRGLRCSSAQGESLSSLLLSGKIDALISPYAPQIDRSAIRHLVTDHAQQDCIYWQTNQVFPIMHAVVLRRDIERRHPGTARRVMEAFTVARDRCIQKLLDPSDMSMPLPFLSSHVEQIKGLFGEDFWPYGFEGNRGTLETFLDFCYEQSVSDRRLRLDELFLSA